MKLYFIRHGDPDYEHDDLTPRGIIEARALAERLASIPVKDYYVSPMGRAKRTASFTLEAVGRTAEVCPWLREFSYPVPRPDMPAGETNIPWDWLPADWTGDPLLYDGDHWFEHPVMAAGGLGSLANNVFAGLDGILADHGYVRDGNLYRVTKPNEDALMFFCHFGVTALLLSHLMGVSPMPLWHNMVTLPTSVTLLVSEERREGIAAFRANCIGDLSHLYVKGIEPSPSARFRETAVTPGRID